MTTLKDMKRRSPEADEAEKKILKLLAKAKTGMTFTRLLRHLKPDLYKEMACHRNLLARTLSRLTASGKLARDERADKVIYSLC